MLQTAEETRFVLDCKVNPAELAGHVKITLGPERIVVSRGESPSHRTAAQKSQLARKLAGLAMPLGSNDFSEFHSLPTAPTRPDSCQEEKATPHGSTRTR